MARNTLKLINIMPKDSKKRRDLKKVEKVSKLNFKKDLFGESTLLFLALRLFQP